MSEKVHARSAGATRRAVVGGVVGLGVGVPLIAACGSDDGGSSGASTASGPIGKTSEVPVGGAKIFTAEKVLVSQPSQGEFRAFSTICTHEQCAITQLKGEEIECACHHSRFKITDGSVVKGPATKPLQTLKVTVEGQNLSVS